MRLSVILVSYNAKYFLVQCLTALFRAGKDLDLDVWVVDNASVDGSADLVEEKFGHQLTLIRNQENVGFGRANNQAIKQCTGDYVLLLNPDTIISSETLHACVAELTQHDDIGAVGVKMIDGAGNYLPESKRGLPTLRSSIMKMSGLYRLFPKSDYFNHYYLGHKDPDQNNDIEVLTGAFMMMPKAVLDEVGGFDERYFMYAEDIDLSYCISKAGYRIRYLAAPSIVHFKGESTDHSTIKYTKVFYHSMLQFVQKYQGELYSPLFSGFLRVAIIFGGVMAFAARSLKSLVRPLIDIMMVWVILLGISQLWATYYHGDATYFPDRFKYISLPIYALTWVIFLSISGHYRHKSLKLSHIVRAILMATLFILAVYGLLPEEWRFSRIVILMGSVLAILWTGFSKFFLLKYQGRKYHQIFKGHHRIAVVGDFGEYDRIRKIVAATGETGSVLGFISQKQGDHPEYLGHLEELQFLVQSRNIDELIFSTAHMSYDQILTYMQSLLGQVRFKIAPQSEDHILSSDSKKMAGQVMTVNADFQLLESHHQWLKRLFDVVFGVILLLLSPILIWFQKRKLAFLKNMVDVILGIRTLGGYERNSPETMDQLPKMKTAVLHPDHPIHLNTLKRALRYAKNYHVGKDFGILLRQWRYLDHRNE